jgi:[acyl-carrier-protein] S-malonyltransferase
VQGGRGARGEARLDATGHRPVAHASPKQGYGAIRVTLREASPRLPRAGYRLLSGIDGETVLDIETGLDKLARQISTTIDWAACLESCRSAGAVAALELGPGTTLSRMASTLFPDGRARAVEEFRGLAGLRMWLQRAVG